MDTVAEDQIEPVWLDAGSCRVGDLERLVARRTRLEEYPHATAIAGNIPIYDGAVVRTLALDRQSRRTLQAEWVRALAVGPGVVACRGGFADPAVVDAATEQFQALIAAEKASGTGGGDHFAKPGANDRVWNALGKLGERAPEVFARYYANEVVALGFEAWLGPGYQLTSQVNSVNPGGAAQQPHRDYHLGFHTVEEMEQFPSHVHAMAPRLVLQGAVAHCDMPLETGPTLLLPYSQRHLQGYLSSSLPEFQACFARHHVQLPLAKGDVVFFNPAVMHAAGSNRTSNVRRIANLLQVLSPYARAMEAVDRTRLCARLYPVLQAQLRSGAIDARGAHNAIAAAGDGYSFPTNLDRDPPVGGLAPETQQALFRRALREDWSPEAFVGALETRAALRHP